MRKLLLAGIALVGLSGVAIADDKDLAYKGIDELQTITSDNLTSSDLIPVYDASADAMKKVASTTLGGALNFEAVTAANTLTTSECGKTMTIASATEFATTLPTATAGCKFKIIVGQAPAGADYTVVTTGAELFYGGVNEREVDTGDDGPTAAADVDTISFRSATGDGGASNGTDQAAVGDWIELVSDGTYWYINGEAKADGAIAFTSAI